MSYIQWIRSQVGTRKIFLVFATVVLRDENGRILLQRRTDFDWWGLPGGALELEEDILTCARRELQEETGLTAGDLRLVGIYTHPRYDVVYPNGDQVQQFTICFTAQMTGGQVQADGVETTANVFFAPELLPWLNLPLWYADMLRDTLRGSEPAFLPPHTAEMTIDQIQDIRPLIGKDWYIGVGAMVVTVRPDGRLLMIQRRDNGAWIFPAGYCELGENVAQTAVRETLEETGYRVELERILGIYSSSRFHHTCPNGDQVKDVGVLFRARLVSVNSEQLSVISGEQVEVDTQEISHVRWMTPDEVLTHVSTNYRFYVEAVLAHLEKGYFVI